MRRLNINAVRFALKDCFSSCLLPMAIALLAYVFFLSIPLPKEIGLTAREGFFSILVAIAALFYPAYHHPGRLGTVFSLSLTLILFALPLSGLWHSGISDPSIIGGLLPWSDASGYYGDAKQVLIGGSFSAFSSRRPLFAGLLAALLGLTQQNLQVSLAILVAITAIACFLLAREIQRSHGTVAGLFVLTFLFLFYRRFAGTTLTENLGCPLGAVGLALLWHAAIQKQLGKALGGLFLLTLALNARAGAFFILPAIVVWGVLYFSQKSRYGVGNLRNELEARAESPNFQFITLLTNTRYRYSLQFLFGGISVIFIGFAINFTLLRVLGSPEGEAFSNFAHTLYGLAEGGKNWTQILVDHPEASEKEYYALAFAAFRQNPFGIVIGAVKAWAQYCLPNWSGAFGFINITSTVTPISRLLVLGIRTILFGLSVWCLIFCYSHRRSPENGLIIALAIGILLSVPCVPPWDADLMRAYAATIPISAVVAAYGNTLLLRSISRTDALTVPQANPQFHFLGWFGLILASLCFVAPIVTESMSRPVQLDRNFTCPGEQVSAYIRTSPGSSIDLVADNEAEQTRLPTVRLSDFRQGLSQLRVASPDLAQKLESLSDLTTLMQANDLQGQNRVWVIAKSDALPSKKGIVCICGRPDTEIADFFHADLIYPMSGRKCKV